MATDSTKTLEQIVDGLPIPKGEIFKKAKDAALEELQELVEAECQIAVDEASDEFQCECDEEAAYQEGLESACGRDVQRLVNIYGLVKSLEFDEALIQIERMVGDAGGHI